MREPSEESRNKKPRLYFVWNYSNWGGAQIYFLAIINTARKFYDITVVMPENSAPRLYDYLNKAEIKYELLPPQTNLISAAGIIAKLKVHIRKITAENQLVNQICARDLAKTILHVDLGFWQSFLPLFRLARRAPVYTTIHTALPPVAGWREIVWKTKGFLISRLKNYHFIASNNDAKKSLRPFISDQKYREIAVAYSGINRAEIERVSAQKIDRAEICRRYNLPENKLLIFSVGQFIERKGCRVVLEAMRELKNNLPNVYFVWLGTTPVDEEATVQIRKFDVEENFRLIGADEIGKTREDLLVLFSAADIFVLASLQEGLPIALVEAMALGKPCISTRINAIPEAIESGANGILIAANNSSQLVEAIVRLAEDKKMRDEFGIRAQQKAFTDFDEEKSAAITLESYEKLAKLQ